MNIHGIVINEHLPTVIRARQLFAWVKFITGEPQNQFRYGAIRAPGAKSRWLAAAVGPDIVLVAGSETFSTPEGAIDWLKSAG